MWLSRMPHFSFGKLQIGIYGKNTASIYIIPSKEILKSFIFYYLSIYLFLHNLAKDKLYSLFGAGIGQDSGLDGLGGDMCLYSRDGGTFSPTAVMKIQVPWDIAKLGVKGIIPRG